MTAFQRDGRDAAECDASAGDELVAERCPATGVVDVVRQRTRKSVYFFLADARQAVLCSFQQKFPKTRREPAGTYGEELLLGVLSPDVLQDADDFILFLSFSVYAQRQLVGVVAEVSGCIA